MHLKNPTSRAKDNLILSNSWKDQSVFQGLIAGVLLNFLLLISLLLPVTSVKAMPVITNTATANFTINGNTLNLSDSVQFTKDTVVTPTDNINLIKTANTSSATIGNSITYSLTLQNPNPRVLTNVVIQDSLPTGLNYIANSAKLNNVVISTSQISSSPASLILNIGDMPANSSWILSYRTNISAATPIGNAINKVIAITDTVTSTQAQANVLLMLLLLSFL